MLLILAGVSIAILTGDNGILTQAVNSKNQNEIGMEKEQIVIAYNSCIVDNLGPNVNALDLQKELEKIVGDGRVYAIDTGDGTFAIEYLDTNRYYIIECGLFQEFVGVDVSELESKLEEYKGIKGQTDIYTETSYNDFMNCYELSKNIVNEKKGTENFIKSMVAKLEEKYSLLKEKQIPRIKGYSLSTDGENIIIKKYTGDHFGDYFPVTKHRYSVSNSCKIGFEGTNSEYAGSG